MHLDNWVLHENRFPESGKHSQGTRYSIVYTNPNFFHDKQIYELFFTKEINEDSFKHEFDDLDVNPNREVFDYNDYKAVYHYDSNGDVDYFEYYYQFDSSAEARDNLSILNDKYIHNEGVNYITYKGSQVKIVFKSEYCKKFKAPSTQMLNVMKGD